MDNGYLASKGEAGSPRDIVRNMSQPNVAVARRWVELFNRRDDVEEFLSLHDPEVELRTPGGPRLRGHDQVLEAGQENVQPRILPERFVAGGDTVVGLGRIELR
jgi:SnoaL-like domain